LLTLFNDRFSNPSETATNLGYLFSRIRATNFAQGPNN
jgi:hypothetical protein